MKAFETSIAICILLVTSVNTRADFPDRVFRFVELTDEDVARIDLKDTSVDDWLEVVGEPSLRPLDFVSSSASVHDPSSLDFRMWLAWHDESDHLYLAAEFIDDVHIDFFDPSNEDFLVSCGEPDMWFFIDGDQGGGLVFPTHGRGGEPRNGRDVQWYFACAGVFDDGVNLRMFENSLFTPWVHLPPFADGGAGWFSEKPTFSIMEFYVTAFDILPWEKGPEESAVSDLYPGKHISFALLINDSDDPTGSGDEGGAYGIFGHNASFDDPDNLENTDYWASGILAGHDEDTAVRDVTWARIKTGLSE